MNKIYRAFLFTLFLIFSAGTALATPLDDYIAKPDRHYSYSVQETVKGEGFTRYTLSMTSQQWRTTSEVDEVLWKHWVTIIKPDIIKQDTALLWITGGVRDAEAPAFSGLFIEIATTTKSVVAIINNVPFQPIHFTDMPDPRLEDDIIAYTFNKYLNGGDAEWPLLLPMAKSAVRAMDTIASHIASVDPDAPAIEKFVVSGASKRGWTTWLTAAADPRVVAIAPMVIDILQFDKQMKHHHNSYGLYSSAIKPYEEMNIINRLETERGIELSKIVDPYSYIDRLTIPKLIINSSGDQFFLPDASRFYFHDLRGSNALRYVPNTEHCMDNSALESLAAFYCCIINEQPLPKVAWTISPDNSTLTAHTDGAPRKVKLWSAVNKSAKDFRLETIGAAWSSTPLAPQENGDYVATFPVPTNGWQAFFIEFTFDAGNDSEHILTTDICITPKTLPQGDGDKTTLKLDTKAL